MELKFFAKSVMDLVKDLDEKTAEDLFIELEDTPYPREYTWDMEVLNGSLAAFSKAARELKLHSLKILKRLEK